MDFEQKIRRYEKNGKTYGFYCTQCNAITPTITGLKRHYRLMHMRGDTGEQILLRFSE